MICIIFLFLGGGWGVPWLLPPSGFSIVLLVVVKEFFGTKLVSSGEESLADLFRRYLSLGHEKTLSQSMICSFYLVCFYFILFFVLV